MCSLDGFSAGAVQTGPEPGTTVLSTAERPRTMNCVSGISYWTADSWRIRYECETQLEPASSGPGSQR